MIVIFTYYVFFRNINRELYNKVMGETIVKHIHIIEMGGTISAEGLNRLDYKDYTSGIYQKDDFLEQIPELTTIASLSFSTFSNISSTKITAQHWLELRTLII